MRHAVAQKTDIPESTYNDGTIDNLIMDIKERLSRSQASVTSLSSTCGEMFRISLYLKYAAVWSEECRSFQVNGESMVLRNLTVGRLIDSLDGCGGDSLIWKEKDGFEDVSFFYPRYLF